MSILIFVILSTLEVITEACLNCMNYVFPTSQYTSIRRKDVDLAEVYRFGTTSDVENRITADQIVAWFRENVSLKARCTTFKPEPMPTSILPGQELCDHIVEG